MSTGSAMTSGWTNPSVVSRPHVRVIWASSAAEFGRPPKLVNCSMVNATTTNTVVDRRIPILDNDASPQCPREILRIRE